MYIKCIEVILKDFMEPARYLIPALLFSAIAVTTVGRICRKKKIRFGKQKSVMWTFFLSYALVVLQTAFLSREPGSRKGISTTLFETWGTDIYGHAFFIENILMFFPFGLLAPMLCSGLRKMWYCVLAGFLCSCAIELAQLMTQRGYCQVDDVMTNTIGSLVGWAVWAGIFKNISKRGFHFAPISSIVSVDTTSGSDRCTK